MIEETLDAISLLSLSQGTIFITVLGGFLFALFTTWVRRLIVPPINAQAQSAIMKNDVFSFVMFFILFPFAHGLLLYSEDGHLDMLVIVTITYWMFFAAFGVTITVIHFMKEWWYRRRG